MSVVSGVTRIVAMTVSCDRPRYLSETLDSWRAVRGREDWSYVFALEPGPHFVECARMIADAFDGLSVTVLANRERKGVLRNPHYVLGYAFERARYALLAEEDVRVSNDILEYFAAMDYEFEVDPAVLAVCGSSWGGSPGEECDAWKLVQGFNPLGWATWADRWIDVLRDTWDLDYSTGLPDGSQAGWDWNIGRLLRARDQFCVFPDVSRSFHIGRHGVHMVEELFEDSQSDTFVPEHSVDHWKAADAAQP